MSSEDNVNNEFGGETGQSDLTLIVEDHIIPVSKSVLCIASPVFRAMFEGEFKEKSKNEIQLPGKRYEDFAEFLRCIYPDKMKEVTEKNAYNLLPLAHEYRVIIMENRCEKIIIQTVKKWYKRDVMQLYKHIQMSETYDLDELKKTCIDLASEHSLSEFKEAHQTYPISDKSDRTIVELALRRHELEKDDEKGFSLITREIQTFGFAEGVTFTLSGSIDTQETRTSHILKNLRLLERFNIKTGETDVKSKMIRNLRDESPVKRDLHTEEFDLLSEDIKVALQWPFCQKGYLEWKKTGKRL